MGATERPMSPGIHSPEYQALVSLLRQRRLDRGLLQTDVAQALGEPQPFVSKYERSERRLTLIDVLRILRVLGENPDRFLADLEAGFPERSDARRAGNGSSSRRLASGKAPRRKRTSP